MARLDKRDIRFLLLEGLMVLFGVLAALLVDEWREERALERDAAAAQERLLEEVRSNLAELESVDSVTRVRLDSLTALRADPDVQGSLAGLSRRFGGYRIPDLNAAAWERVSRSALADHLPAEYLDDAFRLYSGHEYFEELNDQVNRLVYSELYYDPGQREMAMAISQRIMGQQISWAGVFRQRYQEFLDRYGSGA